MPQPSSSRILETLEPMRGFTTPERIKMKRTSSQNNDIFPVTPDESFRPVRQPRNLDSSSQDTQPDLNGDTEFEPPLKLRSSFRLPESAEKPVKFKIFTNDGARGFLSGFANPNRLIPLARRDIPTEASGITKAHDYEGRHIGYIHMGNIDKTEDYESEEDQNEHRQLSESYPVSQSLAVSLSGCLNSTKAVLSLF